MPGRDPRHLEIEVRVQALQAAGEDMAVAKGISHPVAKQRGSLSWTRLYSHSCYFVFDLQVTLQLLVKFRGQLSPSSQKFHIMMAEKEKRKKCIYNSVTLFSNSTWSF